MKKTSIFLTLFSMMTFYDANAANIPTPQPTPIPEKSACQITLDECRKISIGLNKENLSDAACSKCLDTCQRAKKQCGKEKAIDNLSSASAHHLNCTNLCSDLFHLKRGK